MTIILDHLLYTILIADRQDLRTPGSLELRSHISRQSQGSTPEPNMTIVLCLAARRADHLFLRLALLSTKQKKEMSKYIMTRLQKNLSLFLRLFCFLVLAGFGPIKVEL